MDRSFKYKILSEALEEYGNSERVRDPYASEYDIDLIKTYVLFAVDSVLKNAIKVTGHLKDANSFHVFHKNPFTQDEINPTHTALLINIQPIKEETVEDLLRNLIEAPDEQCFSEARVRAEAYLARKK